MADTVRDGKLAGARVCESNLTTVSFPKDSVLWKADLSGVNLQGVKLLGAYLRGADLSGAYLWDASLLEADFRGADLTDANFWGADLSGAYFRGADLTDVNFWDANLFGADLRDADLSEVNLQGADLSGADLRATDLSGKDLCDANFSRADLRDADLSRVDFRGADLSGADLRATDLSGKDLRDANFSRADLRDADLSKADLRGADLSGADLRATDLSGKDLRDANFSRTDLRDADLSRVDLRDANLSKADLRGADLSVLTLNQNTQISGFCNRAEEPDEWDQLARGYHDLKSECSSNGLDEKARMVHSLERWARTREALARRDITTTLSGALSRFLTGYGTRVSYVLSWTIAVILFTTLWYEWTAPAAVWRGGPLYYSITTFVTSPPHPPDTDTGLIGIVTEFIVLFETYFGTILIILLGYVLGNRDQL
ncbi:pentapeptide repeat-containing protein [Salinirubellus sp. GCM10025899]|uniref:pentapeptide repeat-containing protein n=1 Tax=Salinirubellus sp. GCM10025899 TaxID=3252689 RepID=UPI00361846B7